jgi:hypothetical protein
MYEFIVEVLENRQDIRTSHLLTLVQRALQARTYKNPDFRDSSKGYVFPEEFLTEDSWHQLFDRVLGDADMYGAFYSDVLSRDPQSNLLERYGNVKAVAVMLRKLGRLSTFTMLDVGSSLNGGLNLLASGEHLDYPGISKVGVSTPEVYRRRRAFGAQTLYHSRMLTRAYHKVANDDDVTLEYGVGIDRTDPKDAWNWAYANSFNPSEMRNTQRVAFFDRIIAPRIPFTNVGFHRANFETLDIAAFSKKHPGKKWGIVNVSAVLYMSSPEVQAEILTKAAELAEEAVVVSDFGEVPWHRRRQFTTLDDWNSRELPWITAVWDVQESRPKWQPIIHSTDGRVSKIVFGEGRIRGVDGKTSSLWKPIQDYMS